MRVVKDVMKAASSSAQRSGSYPARSLSSNGDSERGEGVGDLRGLGLCPICFEGVGAVDGGKGISAGGCDEPTLETVCCRNVFHISCLELQVQATGGRASCPTCRNSKAFHRQLRAARRLERFGNVDIDDLVDSKLMLSNKQTRGDVDDRSDPTELIGRSVNTWHSVNGVVRAVDRVGRLVLETSDGSIKKVRLASLKSCSTELVSEFLIVSALAATTPTEVTWKEAMTARCSAVGESGESCGHGFGFDFENDGGGNMGGQFRGKRGIGINSRNNPIGKQGSLVHRKSRSRSGRRKSRGHGEKVAVMPKVIKGTGPGFANGVEAGPREWACELCDFLNGQFNRRCVSCSQGCQARSMVGRCVQTTNGPGTVAKSSGKGWVVVETSVGGSYRMRLSSLWDYVFAAGAVSDGIDGSGCAQTASGFALPLPAQRAGDPGMPKNWSFSLLKKRVQTNSGAGIVTDVIDKGWICVKLDSGRKIKTRPGNVTALEGDEVQFI